ncbi:Crp/Fnr family transcriptional regulator [Abyssalbus ytuae]|uniref:Crp/Fnr family transcriptional regulator n=1 Tax=Abyssalbus ytuae TaxID=2926907 RepID=A0A9E6ZY45_9FLAO|nr:Crp/Fnr family transcriptional regulator [Abyssalbus ytuae]UOB16026.1 Crp/Fnr family transcriptional regulator [Abyssalbus ytuae]
MYLKYLNALNDISSLSEKSKKQISDFLTLKKVARDNLLLKQGEVCKHIYFVNRGFLRIFYYKKGKEITEWFTPEKHFCFSIISYFQHVPSKLIIEALEDSEIICFSKDGLDKLIKTNLEVSNLFIKLLSGSLILSQIRMDSVQFETALQRYKRLIEFNPEILQKVPLQHIASYLGITSETLSRIRNQV